MEYFVRILDVRKENRQPGSAPLAKHEYPVKFCFALGQAIDEAKRIVLGSDKSLMLLADACFKNRNFVRTKYRCWIDERGAFHERMLA